MPRTPRPANVNRARVEIDVETEGAQKAASEIDDVSDSVKGLAKSARRTLLPLLGGGLLAAGFAGGLLGLALNSGAAQNALNRLIAVIEPLIDYVLDLLYPLAELGLQWIEQNPELAKWALAIVGGGFALSFLYKTAKAGLGTLRALRGIMLGIAGAVSIASFKIIGIILAVTLAAAALYLLFTRSRAARTVILGGLNAAIGILNVSLLAVLGTINLIIAGINLLIRGINAVKPGRDIGIIPTINVPRIPSVPMSIPSLDEFQGGFWDLRPHERQIIDNVSGAVGGVLGGDTVNNFFGISQEESARTAQTELNDPMARLRALGYA